MAFSNPAKFRIPPPSTSFSRISFPATYILLVTLSRPASLNCINTAGHHELHALWEWYDAEPTLRVGIITGEGQAFCAGADLKEWDSSHQIDAPLVPSLPPSGFGGLSRRKGKKPIIAAVNGLCLGGGCEMVVNADLVLASPNAVFGLPEAKIGVVAIAGALPRLARTVGKQRAMEMALVSRKVQASEARDWGLCNFVLEKAEGGSMTVVDKAVEWAHFIAANSPDSIIVSKAGVDSAWGNADAETEILEKGMYKSMNSGENMREGIKAFVEKRNPKWIDSKL